MTLFFILSSGLLNLLSIVLCDLLISLIIGVGVGSASAVSFGIFGVVCPFVNIIIGVYIFEFGCNMTFSSTYFSS